MSLIKGSAWDTQHVQHKHETQSMHLLCSMIKLPFARLPIIWQIIWSCNQLCTACLAMVGWYISVPKPTSVVCAQLEPSSKLLC